MLLFDRSRCASSSHHAPTMTTAATGGGGIVDSAPRGNGSTIGLLAGQDVFTVPNLRDKL